MSWRGNRPEEDPEKTKSWGWVTAKPSEFLVHVRRGRVLPASGQGASCWKWPRDAVAIVPTSLQKLAFKADQVTVERVGVEVTGLAVYRVAEPLLAYRLVNFSYPERAQQKLEEALTGMFVGAVRRLVANLGVDDCLQRRKDAIAAELLREVAPVVGGRGRPDDHTREGWGIVLDTLEIQEVRVLSEKVFAAMQAPYRAALEQRAREAQLAVEDAVQRRRLEMERVLAEAKLADAVQAHQHAVAEAQAELSANEHRVAVQKQRAERRRSEVALEAELRAVESESQLAANLALAQAARAQAEAELVKAAAEARRLTAEKLPELAAAVGQRIGEVRIHQFGGESNPFAGVVSAVEAVMSLARSKP